MSIAENLRLINHNINKALERSGRKDSVKLIAVSKTMSTDVILKAYTAGQKIFGENRVQEWREKSTVLPEDCEWHIIGRLQTNKVKYLNSRVALIHSLDRFNLLEKLNVEGEKQGLVWKTLLQVNVAQDVAKAGVGIDEVEDFLLTARNYPFVNIIGLMTIGNLEASPAETRLHFRALREIRDKMLEKGVCDSQTFFHLSMGMSQDYETAVEEGATFVRVGSSIFGERQYN
ncbi:MAG: YggS family pyridoxal phosphate-dependent enzyme [Peptococcaceae bacterium]|nr:YggS family pyridoxal phosphate-dependent enzyme [Peptococcaceae bacterium]